MRSSTSFEQFDKCYNEVHARHCMQMVADLCVTCFMCFNVLHCLHRCKMYMWR